MTTVTCRSCGEVVEWESDRWVTARSGDDGGTYDYCPESSDQKHSCRHGRQSCFSCLKDQPVVAMSEE